MTEFDVTKLTKTRIKGIMKRIIKTSGCHFWSGQSHSGRGYVYIDGQYVTVARLMLAINGNYSSDLHVKHTCGDKSCVNPDHLYQGKKR